MYVQLWMYMRFTWDAAKKEANPRNHRGVTFGMAQEVFDDPNAVILDNYFMNEISEQRMQAIGMSGTLLLLAVIFVDRSEDDDPVIHIISARKATAYERGIYERQYR